MVTPRRSLIKIVFSDADFANSLIQRLSNYVSTKGSKLGHFAIEGSNLAT
jgi:hypothetical protein